MVVSESEYVGRMVEGITPLRDVFNSLFFVSMGMLVQPRLWIERPLLIVGLLAGVVIVKTLLAGLVALPLLRSPLTALTVGLGLAQIGELSIIVAVEAARLGLLATAESDIFLAVMVPTLVATPFLMRLGSKLARRSRVAVPRPGLPVALSDHVVIVGYGINGRNVARALSLLEMPHLVVDLSPFSVEEIRSSGGHALEGDACHREVLAAAGFEHARGLVAAIADAASTREVVKTARELNPEAVILARTRYLREVEPLTALGADQVIPEEFETSLELAGRVLALYGAPPYLVEQEKAALRQEGYGLLREGDEASHPKLATLFRLPGLVRLEVEADSEAAGQTLRELDLRGRTGASVVAIESHQELLANPRADQRLNPGDVLIALADGDAFAALQRLLSTGASR
jgi:CPA2 family monovalent cation:H+ antiporter-2